MWILILNWYDIDVRYIGQGEHLRRVVVKFFLLNLTIKNPIGKLAISNWQEWTICEMLISPRISYDILQIYKSTKCNDMQQTGYCPRGPFCAFAHVDRKWNLLL